MWADDTQTMKHARLLFAICISLTFFCLTGHGSEPAHFFIACPPTNDLYRVLLSSGAKVERFDFPSQAVNAADSDSAVLLLAGFYPKYTTHLSEAAWRTAAKKNLKIYIEYSNSIPHIQIGEPKHVRWERAVITSDFFEPRLEKNKILAIHDCYYLPTTQKRAHISLARVAGYDSTVYALPEQTFPILFETEDGNVLVASTALSNFVTARYAPQESWEAIWLRILSWLTPKQPVNSLKWQPSVHPRYTKNEALPSDYEKQALKHGARWFKSSRLLLNPSFKSEIDIRLHVGREQAGSYAPGWMDFEAGPLPSKDLPNGDGSYGILEGYGSRILHDGSQLQRYILRSDCIAESAFALALSGALGIDKTDTKISENLLNYIYRDSVAQRGPRGNPDHPAYGLISWGMSSPEWETAFFGDDNARVILATLGTAGLHHTPQWDKHILKCIVANLRTTGPNGFRPNCISQSRLEENGWRYFFEHENPVYSPHYQAYLWACYLWAFEHTGEAAFLERAEKAIRMTMDAYPGQWKWTLGMSQARARMLLPLAWLVRVSDTPEHRGWLKRVAEDLLAAQQPCGAIREELGILENGSLIPPKTNADFGVNEATILQKDGDPACDLLYTSNFALLGLHEAAAATGEAYYQDAADKLTAFLCRIQIESRDHPELNGGWYRAFDYRLWEYWGSNADAGWGAWCIESGWTQAWITSVLGMRELDTSLWELASHQDIKHLVKPLFDEMFEGR